MSSLDDAISVYEELANKNTRIQEELNNLNNSLSACIDLVSDSIVNPKITQRLSQMKDSNQDSYLRSKNELEDSLKSTRDMINRLNDERKEELERKKEEERREKKEEKKED